ncbi:MAG: hypothetical protein D6796_08290 [Caldilineae bacterium]|nr:MAG: hypothetical protein D6796_08290 [Caldilineae bacterium]
MSTKRKTCHLVPSRWVGMVVAVLLVLGLMGGAVSANGGPHTGTTAANGECRWCHRTNSALGRESLAAQNPTTLCLSCHGTGLGANTNVVDGVYLSSRDDAAGDANLGAANTPDGAPLLGGGFVTYLGKPVTSRHDVTGSPTAAWGNGGIRGERSPLAAPLTCISCHDPHGSANYRLLREFINGRPVRVEAVDEGEAKDYDTEQWGAGTDSLCLACHEAYNTAAPGAGSDPSLVASGGYAHRVGMPYHYDNNANPETEGFNGYRLPLAESGHGDRVVCMTCHLPHGTAAQRSDGGDSRLLRLDNDAVCQVCHQL